MKICVVVFLSVFVFVSSCGKKKDMPPPPPPSPLNLISIKISGVNGGEPYYNIALSPQIKFAFSAPVSRNTVNNNISYKDNMGTPVSFTTTYERSDSVVVLQPSSPLGHVTKYSLDLATGLSSVAGKNLSSAGNISFITKIDSVRKFPVLSDDALLDLVQKQTFKYFWDFGHPVSGLARERNTSGDVVTSGGSGFGMMAIVTAIHRGFISRTEGLLRLQKMVGFLKNTAQKFHGAFPHWLNGATGVVVPFSTKDNGADLVETSYLVQGLLTARQYFNAADPTETSLRNDINQIWQGVEWNWFRRNSENVLYWHWSPIYNWEMNMPVRGWNECLITYVLAAASPNYSIPKIVYDNGWAQNGAIRNGNNYYGVSLPLGPAYGGPLFFAHYSFMGVNPTGLQDAYANYFTQNKNHTLINYNYAIANPKGFFGYSDSCWGLTASDIPSGYTASSPTNDVGVIAPTAALSSFPYTPAESMKALKFFYYVLGDKLWKEYGFVDAFSLHEAWFANSFLAIDQGPIIVMIENYRSGLLWNLFMSCPEVKTGLINLSFQSPYL